MCACVHCHRADEGIEDGEIGDEDTLGDMMMSGDGGLAAMHKEPGHARRSMISFGHDVSSEVRQVTSHDHTILQRSFP